MSPEGGWLQLTLDGVNPALAEAALEAEGALAISLLDAADELLVEPAPGAGPLWRKTRVSGLFPAETEDASLRQALGLALASDSLVIDTKLIEDRDWIRAWMDHYRPMCFGDNLWVCPRTQTADTGDAAVVYLDPGMAFGTGTHPTTALCLEYLAAHPPVGQTVLDYGCGSGILAIAALKLGASKAFYYDIDPQAMKATQLNAADNDVADRLHALDNPASPPPAALVLANILAAPLVQLAPILKSAVDAQGVIVMSGLLERQEDQVRSAYEDSIVFGASGRQEGWSRLNGQRGGS